MITTEQQLFDKFLPRFTPKIEETKFKIEYVFRDSQHSIEGTYTFSPGRGYIGILNVVTGRPCGICMEDIRKIQIVSE